MQALPVSSFDDDVVAEILGPFRYIVKFTLLDCSAKPKCLKLITRLLAIVIVALLFARVGLLFETDGNSLSFAWAESNFFGFTAIHAAVSSICLFGWTMNGFVPKHAKKLARVRLLRMAPNPKMNDFRLVQALAVIFSIPWLFAMMAWIVFNFIHHKILFGGEETNIVFCVLILVSDFYIWFISSVCLAFYILVLSSLNREVACFNQDLERAKTEKILKNIGVLEKFDFRQNEILEMILSANESLSSYANFAPLFMFYGLANGVYLTGCMDSAPLLYFVFLMVFLAAIIVFNLITMSPACSLQEHISATARLLINNDEFECSKDPIVYQTYRVMVDRLRMDTRLYVISAVPIVKNTLAAALFIVPNVGFLLLMVKKVIIANGGHV